MRHILPLAAVLAALGGAAFAQQQPGPGMMGQGGPPSGRQMPFFQTLDTNNDGVVTQEEFLAGHETRRQRYAAVDANNDGTISREEFLQAGQQRREQRFQALDRNGDNMLTQEELQNNTVAMFRAMDDNNDGRITPDEVGRHRGWGPGMMQQQGQMGPGWGPPQR